MADSPCCTQTLEDAIAERLTSAGAHSSCHGAYDLARMVAGAVRRHQQPAVTAAVELAATLEGALDTLHHYYPLIVKGELEPWVADLESAALAVRMAGTLAGWKP